MTVKQVMRPSSSVCNLHVQYNQNFNSFVSIIYFFLPHLSNSLSSRLRLVLTGLHFIINSFSALLRNFNKINSISLRNRNIFVQLFRFVAYLKSLRPFLCFMFRSDSCFYDVIYSNIRRNSALGYHTDTDL